MNEFTHPKTFNAIEEAYGAAKCYSIYEIHEWDKREIAMTLLEEDEDFYFDIMGAYEVKRAIMGFLEVKTDPNKFNHILVDHVFDRAPGLEDMYLQILQSNTDPYVVENMYKEYRRKQACK